MTSPQLRTIAAALLLAAGATAQVSNTAYRVLGQTEFDRSGVNMVQGIELQNPTGIALDARDGQLHLYICDSGNARVLAWQDADSYQAGDPPTLILGQPGPAYSSAMGIGPKGFSSPFGVAVDPRNGNLYVSDTGNHRVLRYPAPFANPKRGEPDSVYGQKDFSSFAAGTSQASLNAPRGLAVDGNGNLWVADSGNNRVLRFPVESLDTPAPVLADIVLGQPDFQANLPNQTTAIVTASTLYTPVGLAVDAQNNLYVADAGNTRVLRYSAPLAPSTAPIAATAVWGQANFTTRGLPQRPSASTVGVPTGVSVDSAGNVYVSSVTDNRVVVFAPGGAGGATANRVIGQPDFSTASANTGSFPMASAQTLSSPSDVKVDQNGNVYVADSGNHRVVETAAGAKAASKLWGQTDFTGNGPNQIKPGSVNLPFKVAIDYSQQPYPLYLSDSNNNRVLIWKDSTAFRNGDPADLVIGQPDMRSNAPNIDTRGTATPSATSLFAPTGIAVDPDNGNLWVADAGNHRVLRYPRPVDQSGRIKPDLVLGQSDFTSSSSAVVNGGSLNTPTAIAFGPNGRLFVSDTGNNRVLEFAPGPTTGATAVRVYGQPDLRTSTRPTQTSAQSLASPRGLFIDAAGNLYVVDAGGSRIMVFTDTANAPAGGAIAAFGLSGIFKAPSDVALDSSANLYVSDTGNNRVIVLSSPVSASGSQVIGVLGQANGGGTSPNFDGSNGLATADSLFGPVGIFVDRQDTVYVGDAGNNRLLHFLKPATTVNAAALQPGAPVGRGGLVTLTGTGISANTESAGGGSWPTSLANRKVLVNDELESPLSLVSPTQANFQAPSAAPLGAQRVAIRVAETNELVAGGKILIASVSPGLFTTNEAGTGQGVVLNQDGSPNGPSNPAAVGSTITLYGTGQGPVSPPVPDGATAPAPMSATVAAPTSDGRTCLTTQPSLCVAIGSGFGTIQASGLAPGSVGVWQIKVTVPQGIVTGNAVPLRVVIAGTPSNLITVAIK